MSDQDRSRSQRSKYPDLFDTLDRAIEQAGVECESDILYAAISTMVRQSNRFPWWKHNLNKIVNQEGGWAQFILAYAGYALCHMSKGLTVFDAAAQANNDYQSDVKRQWQGYPEPLQLGEAEETPDLHLVLNPQPPTPWDGRLTDPRLKQAWELGTDKQREVMKFVADGINLHQAAEHIGVVHSAPGLRLKSLRNKIAKVNGTHAMGPA